MRRIILAALLVLILPVMCSAQPQTGTYSLGAFDAKGFDTINIGNLNAYFSVPVYSKPGRGLPFYYNLAYNSSMWTPVGVSGSQTWVPAYNWGWTAETDAHTGYLVIASISFGTCYVGVHHVSYEIWGNPIYVDTLGVDHHFLDYLGHPVQTSNQQTCTGIPSADTGYATDPSGYTLSMTNSTGTVTSVTGEVISAPSGLSGAGSTVDSNGNEISINLSGQIEDTTGNVVLTATGSGTPASPVTYTYTDTTPTSRHITVNYLSYNIQTAFGCSGISEYSQNGVNLISSISYPDGTSYSFSYEHTYTGSTTYTGRLASVTLPEGGQIQYFYSGGTGTNTTNGIECSDGGTVTLTRSMPNDPLTPSMSYARTLAFNSSTPPVQVSAHTEVVDGLSNYGEYDFVNSATDPNYTPYLINYSQYEGNTSGTLLISNQSCLNTATPSGPTGCAGQALGLPITAIRTTSTLNGTTEKYSSLTFNSYGLVTDDSEYDYGSGSYGAKLSDTQTSYASLSNGIVGLPSTVTTLVPTGGSSVAISTVSYGYDGNSLTSTSGLPQHNSVSGSRGNLTSVQYTTGASSPASITTAQYYYDDAGQLLTSKDEALNSTTYSYDSGTDTFLYSVTYPTTGSVTHSTSSTWDVARGVKLTDHDLNMNQTTYTYDLMLRPSTVSTPASGYQTFAYSYGPSSPYTSVSTLHATGGSYITATSYLDPYGRLIKTDTTDTPSDDLVAYAYDADGNLNSVSNPYRSGGTVSNTVYTFDALARPTKIVDSDGSSQQLASYSGNAVTTTDEASNQRELVIDGLGRTKQVFEPNSSGTLNLETDYLYSQNPTAGSGSTFTTYQTIVNQKGGSGSSLNWRTRTFTFDMLGRTASESTPEAGLISYTYPNGSTSCAGIATLACGRTDANGTTTTYSYDFLNRLTGKTYSGSTLPVSYYYDQSSYNGLTTIANGNGAMTGMSDSSGETAWSFDGMGRTTAVRKKINSVTNQANYTYNADGSTNTMQDFGSTTFTYSYDVSGRPTSIVDGSSNSYASGALYDAAGQLTSLNHQLTSGGGAYVRTINYNTRLQPSFIGAKLNGSNIQSLTYGYGTSGANNGNIHSITNGIDSTRSQTYAYDYMNRLASGQDAGCHWGETYSYDNWGNLYQTTPITGCSGGYTWTATANTKNQLSILSYDLAGEVIQDQYSNTFTYDAEGRILSGGGGIYVYDGAGNRVEKTVSGTATLYWPGAGSILDESNSSGSTMGKQVQFDGLLVWHEDASGNGLFLFHDHLGSTRVTGSASGSLDDDNDYQSYGTLYNNYGASPSDNHYLFTGYESDSETTSDYATFRNLGLEMGRFNRPDPYNGSYDLTNPQSLNRYSYVLNSPLVDIDPLGFVPDCDTWDTYTKLVIVGYDHQGNPVYYTQTVNVVTCFTSPSVNMFSFLGDGGGGGGGGAPNNGTPWYQNSCITSALGAGALSAGFDAIGLIPEAGGIARIIGHGSGYVGVVADQAGNSVIKAVGASTDTVRGLNGLFDTSPQGLISDGLTVAGFIPGLGQLAAGASIVNDAIKTGIAISKCP